MNFFQTHKYLYIILFFFFFFSTKISNIICRTRQSNFPFIPTLDSNATEFQERLSPVFKKPNLILCKALHLSPGPAVADQNGIWLKQPFVWQNVSVVLIVEHKRRRRIVFNGGGRGGASGTPPHELLGVSAVERGVDEGQFAVWVSSEAVAEGAAVGSSDGMGPRENDEIVRRQPFWWEEIHHLVYWKACVDDVWSDIWRRRYLSVSPARRDFDGGPTGLC